MNSNFIESIKVWALLIKCPPARVYAIFMCAVVLFDLYSGYYEQATTNSIAVFVGTLLLWVLCAAKLDFAAYSLLILPVAFFLFLLTAVIYDQYIRGANKVQQKKRESNCGSETCEKPVEVVVPPTCPCSCTEKETCPHKCNA